jgi:hypothetical protein
VDAAGRLVVNPMLQQAAATTNARFLHGQYRGYVVLQWDPIFKFPKKYFYCG